MALHALHICPIAVCCIAPEIAFDMCSVRYQIISRLRVMYSTLWSARLDRGILRRAAAPNAPAEELTRQRQRGFPQTDDRVRWMRRREALPTAATALPKAALTPTPVPVGFPPTREERPTAVGSALFVLSRNKNVARVAK